MGAFSGSCVFYLQLGSISMDRKLIKLLQEFWKLSTLEGYFFLSSQKTDENAQGRSQAYASAAKACEKLLYEKDSPIRSTERKDLMLGDVLFTYQTRPGYFATGEGDPPHVPFGAIVSLRKVDGGDNIEVGLDTGNKISYQTFGKDGFLLVGRK